MVPTIIKMYSRLLGYFQTMRLNGPIHPSSSTRLLPEDIDLFNPALGVSGMSFPSVFLPLSRFFSLAAKRVSAPARRFTTVEVWDRKEEKDALGCQYLFFADSSRLD